jgi:rfaE bifunctional protein nucleotidyltransferase chain/domain
VTYLAWARAQGDALLLGLNEDVSVRALKGPERPLLPFADRAAVLAALRSVDAVVGFAERTPETLLERIRPDVHVKSAQYRVEDLPERIVVLAHGGEIRLAPHVAGRSTTDIVAEIRRRYGSPQA